MNGVPQKVIDSKISLFKRFQIAVESWRKKPSKQKFQMLYNIPKTMFELVGVRVFSDMHLNWYSNLGHVMIFYYVS